MIFEMTKVNRKVLKRPPPITIEKDLQDPKRN
jgi:hypothetical protein